jgi:hypothetical protein
VGEAMSSLSVAEMTQNSGKVPFRADNVTIYIRKYIKRRSDNDPSCSFWNVNLNFTVKVKSVESKIGPFFFQIS